MKVKCSVCKKTFNKETHITALLECLKQKCGLKQSTVKVQRK